jgi:hypothetical protein
MCKSKKVAKMTAKRRSVCKVMDMMMSDSGSSLNAGSLGLRAAATSLSAYAEVD